MEIKEVIPYHRPLTLSVMETEVLINKIKEVLKSGQITNGKYVKKLEKKIRKLYGVDHVIATSNCTMGIMICLEYLNTDYLQAPMFNWWSVLYSLEFLKYYNVAWIDVDINTWLPIESYSSNTLYLNTFGSIGKSLQKDTIYDSSHCLGAEIKEIGLAHIFSLAPTKLITSCEGGIIITNNRALYKWAIERRDKMCRMSEIHALIGLESLKHLDEVLKWKEQVYHNYKSYIPGQFQNISYNSTYNTIGFLNTENLQIPDFIETRQYYEPISNHIIGENTKKIYEQIICLPSYKNCPYNKIIEAIIDFNNL